MIKKVYFCCFLFLSITSSGLQSATPLQDIGRLYTVPVEQVAYPSSEENIRQLLLEAKQKKIPVVTAGKKHSQGAQALCTKGQLIDMNKMNRILQLNVQEKTILVEAGVTWEQIQEAVNPHGLSVKVMQSSNIFTIGGSLSVNAHGRDPHFGSLIQTVRKIKIMGPDGVTRIASREENSDLFHLAIGGYGLFGIILEAELELTANDFYEKQAEVIEMAAYPDYFEKNVLNNPQVGLHFARFSLGDSQNLRNLVAVTHLKTAKSVKGKDQLQQEKNVTLNKTLLNQLRKHTYAKKLLWNIEVWEESKSQIQSRNNAMRPPIKCLDYYSKNDTDILQEYFVPKRNFAAFADRLKEIIEKNGINVMNITVRYMPQDSESFLSYAKEDSFAFVLYINHGLAENDRSHAKAWTQEIVDASLALDGSYYLPYQRHPSAEQMRKAYPQIEEFLKKKKEFDPDGVFQNEFYREYAAPLLNSR